MAFDFARLKSILATSKVQSENNALYQTIFQLIENLRETFNNLTTLTTNFNNLNSALRQVVVLELDTSTLPQTVILSDYLNINNQFFYIFKDTAGNASSNNITLTGDVEGVTDPVINTDYGLMRIYRSLADGLLYQW